MRKKVKLKYVFLRQEPEEPIPLSKAMNVGVPFEISAKGMKNANKARSKRFRKVIFIKHSKNTASNGRKKAVK